MKKYIIILVIISCFSCKTNNSKIEASQAVVQDYSNMFSKKEEQQLAKKIINYEAQTTNQICIYTIDSIPNNETAVYHAASIANRLGVGTKEKNNGLLMLISRLDRQVAIATGAGTENTITDSIAKTIIEKTIVPKFRDTLYFEGVTMGLDSILKKW